MKSSTVFCLLNGENVEKLPQHYPTSAILILMSSSSDLFF